MSAGSQALQAHQVVGEHRVVEHQAAAPATPHWASLSVVTCRRLHEPPRTRTPRPDERHARFAVATTHPNMINPTHGPHHPVGIRRALQRIRIEMAFVRDGESAVHFLKWAIRRVIILSRRPFRWTGKRRKWHAARPAAVGQSPIPLTIAVLGARAQTILRPSKAVVHQLGERKVDVVVADTPKEVDSVGKPVVVLSANPRLAVAGFDPRRYNPIGWPRHARDNVAALGSLDQLPPGVQADRVVSPTDFELIRHCHHVEDVRSFHTDSISRADTLVRLAATGALVHVADRDPCLEALLGEELYDLFTTDIRDTDPMTRELHSIRSRRTALRDHSEERRVRQICKEALGTPVQVPSVSALVATNRPAFMAWGIANVAKQNYPELELVLALHGDGFDEEEMHRTLASSGCAFEVMRMPSTRSYADLLNAASQRASGTLLTTMDDDDVYGADHIWDLVLAREYSGAHLVGKGLEIIYLARSDHTVVRHSYESERYSKNATGSTLMIARDDLDALGGWQSPPAVDTDLINRVIQDGGLVYRTHGRGYIVIRHSSHTWKVTDQYFRDQASSIHRGWHGALSGLDDQRPSVLT